MVAGHGSSPHQVQRPIAIMGLYANSHAIAQPWFFMQIHGWLRSDSCVGSDFRCTQSCLRLKQPHRF
ncbi:hypothetical protein CIPAW_16G050100 [Carya illinoinensis]|nr:hypothetical protein CIPAW_16G050100 [Carya illinoinensis]